MHAYLDSGAWPGRAPVPVRCEPPLLWVSPSAVAPGARPPRGRFVLRAGVFATDVALVVRQGERKLWRVRYRRLVPNRSLGIASAWTDEIDPDGDAVTAAMDAKTLTALVARLVQKEVAHFPDEPLYVVGVVFGGLRFRFSGSMTARILIRDLARTVHCPGRTFFVSLGGRRSRFRRALARVPGALVFPAGT